MMNFGGGPSWQQQQAPSWQQPAAPSWQVGNGGSDPFQAMQELASQAQQLGQQQFQQDASTGAQFMGGQSGGAQPSWLQGDSSPSPMMGSAPAQPSWLQNSAPANTGGPPATPSWLQNEPAAGIGGGQSPAKPSWLQSDAEPTGGGAPAQPSWLQGSGGPAALAQDANPNVDWKGRPINSGAGSQAIQVRPPALASSTGPASMQVDAFGTDSWDTGTDSWDTPSLALTEGGSDGADSWGESTAASWDAQPSGSWQDNSTKGGKGKQQETSNGSWNNSWDNSKTNSSWDNSWQETDNNADSSQGKGNADSIVKGKGITLGSLKGKIVGFSAKGDNSSGKGQADKDDGAKGGKAIKVPPPNKALGAEQQDTGVKGAKPAFLVPLKKGGASIDGAQAEESLGKGTGKVIPSPYNKGKGKAWNSSSNEANTSNEEKVVPKAPVVVPSGKGLGKTVASSWSQATSSNDEKGGAKAPAVIPSGKGFGKSMGNSWSQADEKGSANAPAMVPSGKGFGKSMGNSWSQAEQQSGETGGKGKLIKPPVKSWEKKEEEASNWNSSWSNDAGDSNQSWGEDSNWAQGETVAKASVPPPPQKEPMLAASAKPKPPVPPALPPKILPGGISLTPKVFASVPKNAAPLPPPPGGSTVYGTLTLVFEAEAAGRIIGKAGANIKDIRQKSGADVKVNRDDSSSTCEVEITGQEDKVEKARMQLVQNALQFGFTPEVKGWEVKEEEEMVPHPPPGAPPNNTNPIPVLEADVFGTLTLLFPADIAGRLIGKGGEHIKEVKANSDANVQIEKDDAAGTCDCAITGTGEQVNKARQLLQGMALKMGHVGEMKSWEEGQQGGRGGNKGKRDRDTPANAVSFDKDVAGHILGIGSSNLNKTRTVSGAEITITKLGKEFELGINGNPQQVKQAQDLLNKASDAGKQKGWGNPNWDKTAEPDRGQDEDIMVINLDRANVMKVIGKAGVVAKRLRYESGAHINANLSESDESEEGTCALRVSGTMEAVDKARSMIVDILRSEEASGRDINFQDESYMKIAKNESKRVIGKGGETIKAIRSRTGAKVNAEDVEDLVLLRFTGSFDAVENAREMVMAVLEGKKLEEIMEMEIKETEQTDYRERDREGKGERRKGGGKFGRFARGSKGRKGKGKKRKWQDD